MIVTGTNGAETLTGTKGDDTYSGLGGSDTINATQGNDVIDGGLGGDRFTMIMGNLTRFDAWFGPRTYILTNSLASDSAGLLNSSLTSIERMTINTIGTGDYDDTIDASGFTSTFSLSMIITTGAGSDTIIGTGQADNISAGTGSNWIDAGGGIDTVIISYHNDISGTLFISGTDALLTSDFNGTEVSTVRNAEFFQINPFSSTSGMTVDASGVGSFTGQIGYVLADGNNVVIGHNGVDFFSNSAGWSASVDTLTGNGGADIYDYTFAVGAMNGDTITDLDSDDIIDFQFNTPAQNGGLLADQFIGMAAFSGVAGQYRLATSGNQSFIQADTDGDGLADRTLTISNGAFNIAETSAGSNQLHIAGLVVTGTNSGNTLTGSKGDDLISALGGNDTINVTMGNDTIDGGTGNDRLNIVMSDVSRFDSYAGPRTYTVTNALVTDSSGMLNSGLTSIERMTFNSVGTGDYDDTVDFRGFTIASSVPVTITTGDGNDTIYGSAVNDIIITGRGSNWVDGGDGADEVRLQFDNGLGGTFLVTGSGGSVQTSYNSQANSVLNGEFVNLQGTNFTATNGLTIDASGLAGFGGQLGFFATGGTDVFIGHDGADFFATNFTNTGSGDTYTGNGGADIYDYTFAVAAMDGDTIIDFDADDIIDLAFNNSTNNGGGFLANQFIGNASFGGIAGQYRFDVDIDQGFTYLQVDSNGDGIADQTLTITNGNFALAETSAGSNQLHLIGQSGGSGDDFLVGGLGDDQIYGQGGNDTIAATGGLDQNYGGDGYDQLRFVMANGARFSPAWGSRTFTITDGWVGASDGSVNSYHHEIESIFLNTVNTGSYGDTIDASGSTRDVILRLGGGNDTVFGSTGHDEVLTGLGINTVDTGDGWDQVYAVYDNNPGATAYVTMSGNSVITTVDGLVVNTITNAEVVAIQGGTVGASATVDASGLSGFSGQLVFWDNAAANISIGHAGSDAFANITNYISSGDTYTGNGGADIYDYTYAANAMNGDRVNDFDADDTIDFQFNDPSANGGAICYLFLGTGNYTGVEGQYRYFFADGETRVQADYDGDGVADSTLALVGYHDLLESAPGSNQLVEAAANVINGSASGNTLTGTMGNDIINGLGGNDTINATQGHDVVDGGPGSDTLWFTLSNATRFQQGQSEGRTYVVGNGEVRCDAGELLTSFSSVETVRLTLTGTGDWGDTVDASAVTSGLRVAATFGNGNDTFLGGAGADTITTGLGTDVIDGGAGLDTVVVTDRAGTTITVVSGNASSISVTQDGVLSTTMTSVEEIRVGSTSNAQITDGLIHTIDASGYTGNAQVDFQDHNGTDIFIGSTGRDFFINTSGNTLGGDSYRGNGGADWYDYTVAVSDLNGDTILDFDADDLIDFQFNTPGIIPGALPCYLWLGTGNFTGVAGQYRYQVDGDRTLIQLDTDGNGAADHTMTIANGGFALKETAAGSNQIVLDGAGVNLDGVVADGYVAGATLFVDTNGNGVRDGGEAWTTTDAAGNYVLNVNKAGTIVAVGGTNTDTGLANRMDLKAPFSASVVNPLTTLIAAVIAASGMTATQAEAAVKDAFGLDLSLDLLSTDLLAQGNSAAALDAQKAAAQIVNLVTTVETVPGGTETATVNALADLVGSGPVDLTSASTLGNIVGAAVGSTSGLSGVINQLASEGAAIDAATTLDGIGAAQLAAALTGDDLANTLTGNDADNMILGNGGNDTLFGMGGNDTLDGGSGADRMEGGLGNDLYIVDNTGDQVVEGPGGGTDTVRSSISYTLGANVENLELTGTAANATGNALDNSLTGNAAANTLDGGSGADMMQGGLGNDLYMVDQSGDQVIELSNGGIDTVRSSINYTLGSNIENLELSGSAISGTGNALDNLISGNGLANTLVGGAGNDRLNGGAGNDVLRGNDGFDTVSGGSGNDRFVIDYGTQVASKSGPLSIDLVVDFQAGDKIDLSVLDANTMKTGDQDFSFLGTSVGKDPATVWFKTYDSVQGAEKSLGADIDGVTGTSPYSGPVTVLFGNHDGGGADFAIALIGVGTLQPGDLVLG